VLFGRVVQGLGISCYSTASKSYVADIAPTKRRAEAIGLFAAANSLGLILGPAAGFYIVSLLGFHRLFNVVTGLAIVASIISLFAREKNKPREGQRPSFSWQNGILTVNALPIAWTALFLGMAQSSVTTFMAIFATSRGIENPGFYFTVQAVMLLISRTFSGRFADKYGRASAIIPGIIAMSLALVLLPLMHSILGFMVSAAFIGLGFGTAQPATMALLVDQVNSNQRGLGFATYSMGYDGGMFLGSVIFGVVSQVWGFNVMWPLVAACVLLGLFGVLGASRTKVSISR
jgi:MFS family permease